MRMILPLLACLLPPSGATGACTDGLHNVVQVQELDAGLPLRFLDVSILTYDENRKPACNVDGRAALHFPGFVKFKSGKLELTEALQSDSLTVALTAEHNSFFIGEVCKDGKSTNVFVQDSNCHIDVCEHLQLVCTLLRRPGVWELARLLPHMLPVQVLDHPEVAGDWKADFAVRAGPRVLARLRVKNAESRWLTVDVNTHDEL